MDNNEHSTNLAEVGTDLISRAAAQTELQLSARRYTVAHEAHGEGRVVWSEDLISVSDAMDVLRKIPSAQPTFDARDTQYNIPIGTDCISRQAAIDMCREPRMRNADCSDFEMEIMMLPPIQPAEPKRGRWINGHCSECGEHAPYWCMASTYHESNFCPSCGTKMEVNNESN